MNKEKLQNKLNETNFKTLPEQEAFIWGVDWCEQELQKASKPMSQDKKAFDAGEIGKCKECGAHHPLNEDEICEYCFEPEEL